MQLKTLLVRENPGRSQLLKRSLRDSGHAVVGETATGENLLRLVDETSPDLLLIDNDSPDEALLSQLQELAAHRPIPVVLFTNEDSNGSINKAVRAGVSAYIVNGFDQRRVGSIVKVAVARFNETGNLRQELRTTRAVLEERKAVDRAKGILMRQRGLKEPEAYHALRKMAMDRNLRIGQVAQKLISVSELLN